MKIISIKTDRPYASDRGEVVNDQPFNLAICCAGPCARDRGLYLLERLRTSIRNCPQGVLISTGCLLAAARCQLRAAHDEGTWLIVQPCGVDRRPRGLAIAVGPVLSRRDAETVAAWLENGGLDASLLEPRLRFTPSRFTPSRAVPEGYRGHPMN
jgi:hypothetical protein